MQITRRKLAALLGPAALAAAPQQPPAAVTPEEELKAARDRLRVSLDAVAAQQIPMSTEPAFQFKA